MTLPFRSTVPSIVSFPAASTLSRDELTVLLLESDTLPDAPHPRVPFVTRLTRCGAPSAEAKFVPLIVENPFAWIVKSPLSLTVLHPWRQARAAAVRAARVATAMRAR